MNGERTAKNTLRLVIEKPVKIAFAEKSSSKKGDRIAIFSVVSSLIVAIVSSCNQWLLVSANIAIEKRKVFSSAITTFGESFPERDQQLLDCLDQICEKAWGVAQFLDVTKFGPTIPSKFETLMNDFKASVGACRVKFHSMALSFQILDPSVTVPSEQIKKMIQRVDSLKLLVTEHAQNRIYRPDSPQKPALILVEAELALLRKEASFTFVSLREAAANAVKLDKRHQK